MDLRTHLGASLMSLAAIVIAATGCETNAYCFRDCDTTTSTGTGSGAAPEGGAGAGGGFPNGGSMGQFMTGGDNQGGGACVPDGMEICDGKDNDCSGAVDDIPGIDYNDPKTCGTCENNCYTQLLNVDPQTIQCTPSTSPGELPGLCTGMCASDYYDLDGDGSCEYYCLGTSTNDSECNNKDDDCDNQVDEDVNKCTSELNCGKCGGICQVANGTPICVATGGPPCDQSNAHCEVLSCDPGYVDLDGSYATGCEYQCTPTNGGVEKCGDQIDNDCDGKIDAADDLSGDPAIGVACFGDPDGICGTLLHQGVTACVNGQVTCTGANVLVEGQVPESCNGADDDCDGAIDNNAMGVGSPCGQSNIFPCTFGTNQCQNGALVCVGDINPGTETCNGQDDNCDGSIDLAGGLPPMDAMGTCNVPTPPPPGATSPCMAGTKACVGGAIVCQGSVGPQGPDTCGVDANCDGQLTNQPNTMTDVHNCGTCGHDCYAGAVHSNWACTNGGCAFQGCQPGYYDLDGNNTCEYACTFVSSQEACNGADDNCNGQIDEGVVAPSPKQVCGVSPAASAPECTTNVTVACQAGAWKCTFPASVCSPTCATATEVCDGLDNDCDGTTNENVPNYGQPCASDDGIPAPGHGACRTTGTFVCNGANATTCSAVKANCATLPGGCTELCDGIDNDCDGSVDEPKSSPGTNATNYYKPKVIQVVNNALWISQYEISRPNATNAAPGLGNGYWTSAPPGTTLDKTRACSEQNKIPWFNVTPQEVEQTCIAAGGSICSLTQWRDTCHVVADMANPDCLFGYSAIGAPCTSSYTATKYCNLGPSYDFSAAAGDQDGLLPTGSALLQNCQAPWTGLLGNTSGVFDMTGNLREITRLNATTYTLMGGAFDSSSETGSSCDFTFYNVDNEFKFFDTGFRCCFTTNPN
ncbi:MAG: MopE-related protein [Polyangiaceae bacterium]